MEIKHLCVVVAGVLCMGMLFSVHKEKTWFVDENLIYERGSELSSEYLQLHAPEFDKMLTERMPWVVRIEVQHSFVDGGYSSNHGTGMILKGGLVLTASHVLTENVKGGRTKILLTCADGQVLSAELQDAGSGDWALVRIRRESGQESGMNSPIVIGQARQGEMAVFLGFPARLGLNERGKVESYGMGNSAEGTPTSRLLPMLVVGSVADAEALTLDPLAGFPPVGGMSGGPMLNSKGELIGIQISVSKTTENATGRVLRYTINAVPASRAKK
jgi:S1-C subfamily serine protease